MVLGGFLLLSIFWLVEVIQREVYTVYNTYTAVTLGVLTLILTIGGLVQEKVKGVVYTSEPRPDVRLNEDVIVKIKKRMQEQNDYLNPTLTLKEFASNCGFPPRIISEHLNQGLGKHFHDFVNEYRVEAVKNKLQARAQDNYTLESIAYDCGFNSQATFQRVFKKMTQLSPKEFMESQVKN